MNAIGTALCLVAGAGTTTDRVVLMTIVLAVAAWVVWNATKVWQGDEVHAVEQHERTVGPWPGGWGSRRRYRSYLGAGFLGFPIGLGLGVVALTDLVRMTLGRSEAWGPWWVASYIGMVLLVVGVALVVVYQWHGLPDPLRPRRQRGWEVVDGELVLVRPGRTPSERRERRPLWLDPTSPASSPLWLDPTSPASSPTWSDADPGERR